jgi:hypothetical protein
MSEGKDIKRYVIKNIDGNQNQVHFQFYRQRHFYYAVQDFYSGEMWEFPVPLDDIGTATLNRTDKAITFMRWIRKAIENKTFVKQ